MKLDDTAKATEFSDGICTCKSCDHRIGFECIKANCTCCKQIYHSMVLDGIEGFVSQAKQ